MKVKVLTSCKINVIQSGKKVLKSCTKGDIVEVSSLVDIHRIVKEVTQDEVVEAKPKKRRSQKNRKDSNYETR